MVLVMGITASLFLSIASRRTVMRYWIMRTHQGKVEYWTAWGEWAEGNFFADTFGEQEAQFIAASLPGARLVRAN